MSYDNDARTVLTGGPSSDVDYDGVLGVDESDDASGLRDFEREGGSVMFSAPEFDWSPLFLPVSASLVDEASSASQPRALDSSASVYQRRSESAMKGQCEGQRRTGQKCTPCLPNKVTSIAAGRWTCKRHAISARHHCLLYFDRSFSSISTQRRRSAGSVRRVSLNSLPPMTLSRKHSLLTSYACPLSSGSSRG